MVPECVPRQTADLTMILMCIRSRRCVRMISGLTRSFSTSNHDLICFTLLREQSVLKRHYLRPWALRAACDNRKSAAEALASRSRNPQPLEEHTSEHPDECPDPASLEASLPRQSRCHLNARLSRAPTNDRRAQRAAVPSWRSRGTETFGGASRHGISPRSIISSSTCLSLSVSIARQKPSYL